MTKLFRWWKNSSWNLREKEENYYQFAHEVDLDYNDMFATEIFDNPVALHETSKKKSQALIWAIEPSTSKMKLCHLFNE
jgi:hypothetical protein